MKEELFTERLESVHEGASILHSEKPSSLKFAFEELDVHEVRPNFWLSQTELASMPGISEDVPQN